MYAMMFEEEVWESVGVVSGTDYTGLYEVSNFGNVRSLDRQIVDSIGRKYFLKGTFLKPYKSKSTGYMVVGLRHGRSNSHTCQVHQLVMNVFNPNPNPEIYTAINHIDEDKTNNKLDNLEWVTDKENNNHGTRNKRVSDSLRKKLGRKIVQLSLDLEFIKEWDSFVLIHETVGYSEGIKSCLRKVSKSSSGYRWVYAEEYYSGKYLTFYNSDNLQNKNYRKIVQMDLDYNFIKQWDSISEASRDGFLRTSISRCLRGERNKYRGFRWMYLEDYKKMSESK